MERHYNYGDPEDFIEYLTNLFDLALAVRALGVAEACANALVELGSEP